MTLRNCHLAMEWVGKLFCLLSLTTPFAQALQRAEGPQPLGRTTVILPNASQWYLLESRPWNNPFGGEQAGEFPAQYKIWGLLSSTKGLQGLVLMRSSAAHVLSAGTSMQWTNNCKPDPKAYVVDGTRGSFDRVDCLKVSGQVSMRPNWPIELKGAGAALDADGVDVPPYMVLTSHLVTSPTGGFVHTWVLTSPKFQGVQGEPALPAQLNAILPQIAVWADLLARAARNSMASISGEYRLPDMNFSE